MEEKKNVTSLAQFRVIKDFFNEEKNKEYTKENITRFFVENIVIAEEDLSAVMNAIYQLDIMIENFIYGDELFTSYNETIEYNRVLELYKEQKKVLNRMKKNIMKRYKYLFYQLFQSDEYRQLLSERVPCLKENDYHFKTFCFDCADYVVNILADRIETGEEGGDFFKNLNEIIIYYFEEV